MANVVDIQNVEIATVNLLLQIPSNLSKSLLTICIILLFVVVVLLLWLLKVFPYKSILFFLEHV